MKKVLMLSWCLVLCINLLAQQRVTKNDVRQETVSVNQLVFGKEVTTESAVPFMPISANSVVVNRFQDLEEATSMWTTYDLQSNQYCSNRMYQTPNGSIGVAATMSHQYNQTASDRGTGYNFYNGSYWQNQPNNRIENFKTGWPTIAQWGSNGEILICHGNSHLQCYTRSTVGQGQWVYKGELPDYPAGYPYAGASDAYPTWARVVTSGNNHNIIHVVACIQHSISSDETVNHQVYLRSTDAVNWTVSYSPLASLGYETGYFSADNYCIAANGHDVAILYSGCLTNSTWMFKSTNDGGTWNAIKVWEDPYEGISMSNPGFEYTDTLFRPMNGNVVIDNSGVAHIALNTFAMIHNSDNEPGYYTLFYGRTSDGILYWNDTQVAPIQSENGNPHDAARLWWPDEDNPGYMIMHNDPEKWIGMVPTFEGFFFENAMFYHLGTEYVHKFYGASGHPSLSCDPYGNLACAFSTPCVKRSSYDNYYYRSIYVSYRNVNEGYWHQMVDDLTDPNFNISFSGSENMFTISAPNTVNPGEYWFGFQSDNEIGLYLGSNAQQSSASENDIFVVKVQADPEFVGVVTNYTINVSANPTNGGNVTGGGIYQQGQQCTVSATPASNFTFLRWTENGTQVSTNLNYTFSVTGDRNLVAQFQAQPQNYTISLSADPSNGGSVTGGGIYQQGQQCTVTATPASNFTFLRWTENGAQVSTNLNYTFSVTGDRNLVAHFNEIIPEYTITVNADPANGGVVSGGGTYPLGATCVLTAYPNAGFVFQNWTHNGVEVSTNPTYDFEVNRDATYVAHFMQDTNHCTITAMAEPVEGGAVFGSGTYELGAQCTLSAIPSVGFEFVNWTTQDGNQVSIENSFSFSVTSNAVYVAHFERIVNQYTVTVNVEPAGAGSVIGAGTFDEGDNCTLIAIPNPMYSFVSWTENGIVVDINDLYTFSVDRDRNFVAVFSQGLFYTITASAGANGNISPEGEMMVTPGEDKTFSMIPNSGCQVSKVLVDGVDRGPIPSYTFRNVNESHTIHVEFSGLGVDDNVGINLKVYPNPANDKINIESPNMKRIAVFDMLGVLIESKEVNDEQATLSLIGYSQGTYILKVEYIDEGVGYSRFVVVE